MATVGRKAKPSALHALEGTRNRRKNVEPQPDGIPTCPGHLDAKAKTEWKRVSKELLAVGLLTSVDRAALAAYCACWSRWVAAELKIQQTDTVVVSPKGYPIQNPYVGIANRSLELMAKFLTEFGLTPASRTRLSVDSGGTGGDPFSEFMNSIGATDEYNPDAANED